MAVTGSAWLDFVIGFVVSLISSIMNAAGLNLLKLDHVRNSSLPPERQRNDCGRPLWHIGLYLYIASQLAGSTIALNFLKTQWVAPLGSIALIFNFVFAKILVGTQITKKDVYGTIVVMVSVIWIVVFGGMNSGGDIEERLTLADLKALFARIVFIIYFSILNAVIFAFLALGMYAYWAISLDDESGQLRKKMKTKLTQLLGTNRFARASGLTLEGDEGLEAQARDQRLKKVVAMIMSACGGLLASQTLLLAKSGVKLITSSLGGQNQFTDYLSFFILFVLVFTAILQVYCLNTALKLYDSVLVVPTFYGFYTAFGLINSTIYLNTLGSYEPWVLLLVILGIVALIYGVKMLSAPKPDPTTAGEPLSSLDNMYEDEDDEETAHEMEQRNKSGSGVRDGDGSIKKSKKKRSKRQNEGVGAGSGSGDMRSPGVGSINSEDSTSLYSSRRGMMMDPDDISSEISSTVGSRSDRGGGAGSSSRRGASFSSKASFQSDPFRTPKDSQSVHEGFIGSGIAAVSAAAVTLGTGVRRSILFRDYSETAQKGRERDHVEEPLTHVLVDTTDGLDSDSEVSPHQQQLEEELRRESVLRESLKTLTLHEKRRSGSGQIHSLNFQPPLESSSQPRIDTTVSVTPTTGGASGRSRRESARLSSSSSLNGIMSPSQFRAQYTNSPLPARPKHMPELEQQQSSFDAGTNGFGSAPMSSAGPAPTPLNPSGISPQQVTNVAKGHSIRWSTGSSKFEQTFEDLNPFKVLRGSKRESINGSASISPSSVPSSPGPNRQQQQQQQQQESSASFSSTQPPEPHQRHQRQESFSGLPSEWGVPGRKKRHSMLFGQGGRSNSASGGLAGTSSSSSSSTGSPASPPSPRVTTSAADGHGNTEDGQIPRSLSPTPSPRQSRIMSSPELNFGPIPIPYAGEDEVVVAITTLPSDGASPQEPSKYRNHYFTGTPVIAPRPTS